LLLLSWLCNDAGSVNSCPLLPSYCDQHRRVDRENRRHMIWLVVSCGRFATTIHILVSAVVKLTRAEKLPAGLELYRGLGGSMELPEQFYKGDENGCRGYTEWGFLSTSSNKATAVEVRCWQWQRRFELKAATLRLVTVLLLAHLPSCCRRSVYTSPCTG
jgi:hypothetical protein